MQQPQQLKTVVLAKKKTNPEKSYNYKVIQFFRHGNFLLKYVNTRYSFLDQAGVVPML